MTQPDQYQRIVTGALLCLSDRYTQALHSGSIAFRTNAHNLLTPSSTPPDSNPNPASRIDNLRHPLPFGLIHLTTTTHIHPHRQTWTHGEFHIKASIDFAGDAPFTVEEKIRGSGEEVSQWSRDFMCRLGVWCQGKAGFFRVVKRCVEVEEWEGRVGEVRVGF